VARSGLRDCFEAESLRLLEAGREKLTRHHRKGRQHGFTSRRIRVVEEPLTPYMQWELHALRVRAESGGPIHVIDVDKVVRYESDGPLPEIYTLGSQVMYEAVYDERGILEAARKYVDRDLILRCQSFIQELYQAGEPLLDWFEEHVAHLPPPLVRT
jgi:hypothetical protein